MVTGFGDWNAKLAAIASTKNAFQMTEMLT
jgi:hypothetical protein